MANGVRWVDTSCRPQLEQPFLAYIGYKKYAKFGDWLYKINGVGDNYNKSFGYLRPDNFVKRALQVSREGRIMRGDLDQKTIRYLTDMKKELLAQEKRLYKDLKCGDFFGFKALWDGQKLTNSSGTLEERSQQWLDYHLKLLSGETQRLATSKDYTLIEQILSLAAIELDKIDIAGIEGSDNSGKRKIKEALMNMGYLEFRAEDIRWRSAEKGGGVFIPTKKYRKKTESEFIEIIRQFFVENAAKTVKEAAATGISKGLSEKLAQGIGLVQDRMKRREINNEIPRMDTGFVNMTFRQYKGETHVDAVARKVYEFMEKARIFDLTTEELEIWKADNQDGQMEEYIKQKVYELCQAYLSTRDPLKLNYKDDPGVMGFLGELGTFGVGYFHLKNLSTSRLKIDIFDIGSFYSKKTDQLFGSDTVIVVKGKQYGIQTKNPYQITNGTYLTYKKELEFTSQEKIREVLNFFGFNETQWNLFEMYNININNSTTPELLKKQILQFLLMYSGQFARLNKDKIKDDLSKYQNHVLKSLQGKQINNVFFVLKGSIIPSSYILQGLINQYKFLMTDWEEYSKQNNSERTLLLNYTNTIPTNRMSDEKDEGKSFEEVGYKYVDLNVNELLKEIKITSKLKLKIPSIAELTDLYDER